MKYPIPSLLALALLLFSANRGQSQTGRLLPPLRTCEFTHVTVDERGVVILTEKKTTRCFDEELGNGLKLTMVEIPEGDFVMGSPDSERSRESDEGPQHLVHVRRFFLGQFEVTNEQWEAVRKLHRVRDTLYEALTSVVGKTHPRVSADGIRWSWANEFCLRLSKLSGRKYRLPSESEWEYAARGGSSSAFAYGPTVTNQLVNWRRVTGEGSFGAMEVGTAGPANAFGLYDMHGNSAEWVADRYHPDYAGAPNDGSLFIKESKNIENRRDFVIRGGSWSNASLARLRSAARMHFSSDCWASGFGMRVALTVTE